MKKLLITKDMIFPSNDRFEVVGVFNAGCTEFEGKTLLLLRVAERVKKVSDEYLQIPVLDSISDTVTTKKFYYKDTSFDFSDIRLIKGKDITYLTSMSHFRIATSEDGIHFTISDKADILPSGMYETNGIEDPRITKIGADYYIAYACSSVHGILTGVIKTHDFKNFLRLGYAFHPDNKDMAIFPEKFSGKYLCLHRPSTSDFGKRSIWLAESSDLICWGNHRVLITPRKGYFDSERVGAGAPPFLINNGWLEIYHGANERNEYCIGALLLDKNDPSKVICRSEVPLVSATQNFEKEGFFPNVVFTCGLIETNPLIRIYYGASDQSVALVEFTVTEVLEHLGFKMSKKVV